MSEIKQLTHLGVSLSLSCFGFTGLDRAPTRMAITAPCSCKFCMSGAALQSHQHRHQHIVYATSGCITGLVKSGFDGFKDGGQQWPPLLSSLSLSEAHACCKYSGQLSTVTS